MNSSKWSTLLSYKNTAEKRNNYPSNTVQNSIIILKYHDIRDLRKRCREFPIYDCSNNLNKYLNKNIIDETISLTCICSINFHRRIFTSDKYEWWRLLTILSAFSTITKGVIFRSCDCFMVVWLFIIWSTHTTRTQFNNTN